MNTIHSLLYTLSERKDLRHKGGLCAINSIVLSELAKQECESQGPGSFAPGRKDPGFVLQ